MDRAATEEEARVDDLPRSTLPLKLRLSRFCGKNACFSITAQQDEHRVGA